MNAPSTVFAPVHAAMQRYVDADLLAGLSSAVLVGREVVDIHCAGWADRERNVALRDDHLFRMFSNTKLITSCAVMLLVEDGKLQLDEPIEKHLPQLADRQVLRPGATELTDTEPAQRSITARHLLSHSSGLSYGLLDPGSLIHRAYTERKVLTPMSTLAAMMDALADLPLTYQPGTDWEYSIASDVLGRLVEVISGQSFDTFLAARIFGPLGMTDTGFVVPAGDRDRFTAYYKGAELMQPMKPGLTRADNSPYPGAYLSPVPRLSGGGGLVSSLPDTIALIRSLIPGGKTLLRPDTLAQMVRNQLPEGVSIGFPIIGKTPGKGFGLGGAVTLTPSPYDPPNSVGEFQWGGVGGTHWWISPRNNLAGILMTQREWSFWHPFSFEIKRAVYEVAAPR